jgi:uncharacterized protein YgbK (DUF1537 family)
MSSSGGPLLARSQKHDDRPEIDPGVPVRVADRSGPLGLALKSGNFGAPDFFAKALGRIAGHE